MDWEVIIAIFMILGGLSALFDHILKEDAVTKTKVEILRWWEVLNRFDSSACVKNTNRLFIKIFDDVYGERHLTIKCFFRSCLFSSLGLIFAISICNFLQPEHIRTDQLAYIGDLAGPILLFFGNLIADYLSLIETRYILKFAYTRSLPLLIPLLLVDILLSLTCYFVVAVGIFFIIIGHFSAWKVMPGNLFEIGGPTPFIYSTFFTSVIFYLFVLTTMAIKFLHFLRLPISVALRWLGSLDNPFKTVTGIAAAIVFLIQGLKRLL